MSRRLTAAPDLQGGVDIAETQNVPGRPHYRKGSGVGDADLCAKGVAGFQVVQKRRVGGRIPQGFQGKDVRGEVGADIVLAKVEFGHIDQSTFP